MDAAGAIIIDISRQIGKIGVKQKGDDFEEKVRLGWVELGCFTDPALIVSKIAGDAFLQWFTGGYSAITLRRWPLGGERPERSV
jgi:hypothetical protein